MEESLHVEFRTLYFYNNSLFSQQVLVLKAKSRNNVTGVRNLHRQKQLATYPPLPLLQHPHLLNNPQLELPFLHTFLLQLHHHVLPLLVPLFLLLDQVSSRLFFILNSSISSKLFLLEIQLRSSLIDPVLLLEET